MTVALEDLEAALAHVGFRATRVEISKTGAIYQAAARRGSTFVVGTGPTDEVAAVGCIADARTRAAQPDP